MHLIITLIMLHYVWTWALSLIKPLSAAHSDESSGEARGKAAEARVSKEWKARKYRAQLKWCHFGCRESRMEKNPDLIHP